jgi:predicted transcriptional regulator
MKKQLSISIKGAGESANEFVEAWRRAQQGKPAEQPIERLYFEDLATMLKVLTPRRLEVLKVLHAIGPVSVRALAGRIKRDYKNVHHDLQVLERVGLVTRSADGRLIAPWKKIIAEIALAA